MIKIGRRARQECLLRFYVGLAICAVLLLVFSLQPEILRQTDRNVYDVFLRQAQGGSPSPTPAFIDIDEKSLAQLGQWPWPRNVLAKLVKELTENGAAAIGLDIVLSEPDKTSIVNIQKSFQQSFGIDIPIDSISEELRDNDAWLAHILAQTPTVLGTYVRFNGEKISLPADVFPQEGIVEIAPPQSLGPRTFMHTGQSATLPLPELRAVAPLGTINVDPDPDGIVRSIPLLTQVDGRIMISLGLRALMRALGKNTLILRSNQDGLESVTLDKYTFPITPDGRFTLAFRGPRGQYPTFSAVDILQNKISQEEIQGRVFIVGTSAAGLFDIRATPFDSNYPGAEIHAVVVDTILSKRAMEISPLSLGVQVETILLFGLTGTVIFALIPAVTYLPLLALFILAILARSWHHFQNEVYTSPLYSILTLASLGIALLAVRLWQEGRQKRTLRNAFSRYIAPDMVTHIVDKGEAVLMGEEREVSLLFADIRGFTNLSEQLDPDQVVHILNRYFTPMTAIIRNNQGTIDKFIGDAVMAFWNAPLDVARHPLRAIHSALCMQEALEELNKDLHKEYQITLRIGIGVHTGKVYVGNMGSAELLDYTCIGDTVNLTSRIESLCVAYGIPLLTTGDTVRHCQSYNKTPQQAAKLTAQQKIREVKKIGKTKEAKELEALPFFWPLDSIRVKGKTKAIEIFTVLSLEAYTQRQEEIQAFLDAKEHYMQGNFAKAQQDFASLAKLYTPNTLYQFYATRCQKLLDEPPTQWDGVWTFLRK